MTARPRFVLVTPARDEATDIVETMESIIGQSLRPVRWVIVDDGSTDDTSTLVSRRITGLDWITLVRRDSPSYAADFVSKVHAVETGVQALEGINYEFIGTLDADISLERDYFQKLFRAFEKRPRLGIAGRACDRGVRRAAGTSARQRE